MYQFAVCIFLINRYCHLKIAHFHLFLFPFLAFSLSSQSKWAIQFIHVCLSTFICIYVEERLHVENRCAEKFHIIFINFVWANRRARETWFLECYVHACVPACVSVHCSYTRIWAKNWCGSCFSLFQRQLQLSLDGWLKRMDYECDVIIWFSDLCHFFPSFELSRLRRDYCATWNLINPIWN